MHAGTWAEDIAWQMDDGPMFDNYANYETRYDTLCLPPGQHTFLYFDVYGDGWTGAGYWELLQGETVIAGGPTAGQVTGFGGEYTLMLADDGTASMVDETTIRVHVHTAIWGNEITWNIDGGATCLLYTSPSPRDS